MYRTTLASTSRAALVSARQPLSRASLHTSPAAAKTVTEKVKEVASDVNLKVGQTLAGGIEKGQQAAEATKQAVGGSTVSEVADNVGRSDEAITRSLMTACSSTRARAGDLRLPSRKARKQLPRHKK